VVLDVEFGDDIELIVVDDENLDRAPLFLSQVDHPRVIRRVPLVALHIYE
jgi:hypothetical protein